jgi:hypothetical protein
LTLRVGATAMAAAHRPKNAAPAQGRVRARLVMGSAPTVRGPEEIWPRMNADERRFEKRAAIGVHPR